MDFDDILVTEHTTEEHLHNLEEVQKCLEEAGMRLKKDKCAFLLPQIEYLGHVISQQGLHPSGSKVAAVVNAPVSTNVTELRSLLDLVNYYEKFLPNFASIFAPLYKLLQKGASWYWGGEQKEALAEVKRLLQSPNLLVHFDGSKPLVLACDASPCGVGAVLSHQQEDGSERPIAFASRTLAPAEKKYSQFKVQLNQKLCPNNFATLPLHCNSFLYFSIVLHSLIKSTVSAGFTYMSLNESCSIPGT